jgi:hypothetical protein
MSDSTCDYKYERMILDREMRYGTRERRYTQSSATGSNITKPKGDNYPFIGGLGRKHTDKEPAVQGTVGEQNIEQAVDGKQAD